MTQKKYRTEDHSVVQDGYLTISETLGVTGATTFSSTVTVSGELTFNALELVQTLGGTDVTATWAGAAAPVLTIGNYFFTFTNGASTFRVPCFPTT